MHRLTTSLLAALMLVAVVSTPAAADPGHDDWHKIKGRLFGDAFISGKAVYRERNRDSAVERRFQIQLRNAAPGQAFDVFINDQFIDTVTASGTGVIRYQLRTPQFIDEPGDGLPMPNDFPEIGIGDTVVVGHLSGVFFDLDDDLFDDDQRFRLREDLRNQELDVTVKYRERFVEGRLLRRFRVRVEDAPPGSVYDVFVNGEFVASVVIDDDEDGLIELRTPSFIDDPGDGDPMPRSFPTLLDGDIVTVGPLTGELHLD